MSTKKYSRYSNKKSTCRKCKQRFKVNTSPSMFRCKECCDKAESNFNAEIIRLEAEMLK